jgi:putative membrane protein
MMGDTVDMMGGTFLWAVLILILLAMVAGVVGAVVLITRAPGASTAREPQPGDAAREILRRHYAAGEVDEDEYLTRLSGLGQR